LLATCVKKEKNRRYCIRRCNWEWFASRNWHGVLMYSEGNTSRS